jgi:hypothetical protein
MVYTMYDVDTNKDGKLDASDIKSLYLSEISGADLQNFSDFQELIDWSLIESKNRCTLEPLKTLIKWTIR